MTTTTKARRARVHNVLVGVRALEARLEVAAAQGLGPDQKAAAAGVRTLLRQAEDAASGVDPRPGRILRDRWSGTLVEAAYENLHAARAQMVDVYDEAELAAEVPAAVARAQQTLHRDDPRRAVVERISDAPLAYQRALLRRAIEDSYDSMDRQHARLRSFRNIILVLAMFITTLVAATILVVALRPSFMPLCFPSNATSPDGQTLINCPTGSKVLTSDSMDIIVVALLGLLGGALAAAVSIRNLKGTSTPYDVPVAMSLLKVPLGAFTAILGLVAIRGDFVPGLSRLDSQQQILAYALVLGYAQQVFTYSLDRRAQSLLEALPAKDASSQPAGTASGAHSLPPPSTRPVAGQRPSTPQQSAAPAPGPSANGAPAASPDSVNLRQPELASAPARADEEVEQDDGTPPLPSPSVGDHR